MLKPRSNFLRKAAFKSIGMLLSFAFLAGPSCIKGPGFLGSAKGGYSSNQRILVSTNSPVAVSQSQVSGTTVAKVSSQSSVTQEVAVPKDSDVSGTTIAFPPGSLAIDTEISVQESIPVATSTATAELGIQTTVTPASKAVAVQSTTQADPAQPFTVTLSIPWSGLAADSLDLQGNNLIIVYRVQSYAEGKTLVGVISSGEIEKGQNFVKFYSRYFGAFQAAYSSVPVTKPQSVVSVVPVQTKKEVQNLPPLAVTGRSPVVVSGGTAVTITGKNFRPTMAIALGGKKVGELKILSDTQASFVAPADAGFGLNSLELIQDGTAQTMSIFYKGDKSDFPIMTEIPENVCAGAKYYDQIGTLRVGTKPCFAAAAVIYVSCAKDGETGCLATASFPAVATTDLAAKVKSGEIVGGISGTLKLPPSCSASAEVGCMTTATYKSADWTNLIASNIKNGASVAGLTGTYPSSGNLLNGASTTADLDSGTFNTKIKSATAFEYFGPDGTRYTGAGDGDIAAGNILGSVDLFGTVGSVTPSLANCSSDGQTSCVSVASYTAAATTGLAGKVISGNTVAGVSGNVTLPAIGKVLSGISFGVSGTGLTGTLSLPAAANVVAGSGTYGDPGAAVTPSYNVSSVPWRPATPTITATSFNFGPDRVSVTWSAVSGATGYIVLMNTTSAVSWTPTDGVTYSTGSYGGDTMIYAGSGTTVTYNTTVSAGTNFYFAVYAYQTNIIYSNAPGTKTMISCADLAGGTWIPVPGDSIYGTNGFCVQKYLPSNVSGVPASQTGTTPWVSITQTAALTACTGLGMGYHLITNPEWMTIAANIANTGSNWSSASVGSGALAQGHSDNNPATACAADANDANGWVETNCTGQTQGGLAWSQKRTRTLSNNYIIWDIGGNLWQWLDYNNASDKPTPATAAL